MTVPFGTPGKSFSNICQKKKYRSDDIWGDGSINIPIRRPQMLKT